VPVTWLFNLILKPLGLHLIILSVVTAFS